MKKEVKVFPKVVKKPTINIKTPQKEIKKSPKMRRMSPLVILLILLVFVFFYSIYNSQYATPPVTESTDLTEEKSTPTEEQEIPEEQPGEIEETTPEEEIPVETIPVEEKPVEHIIKITRTGFVPKIITISEGETVTWINEDRSPHGITARDKTFHKRRLMPDEEFSYTFTEKGTFRYIGIISNYLQGTITVE